MNMTTPTGTRRPRALGALVAASFLHATSIPAARADEAPSLPPVGLASGASAVAMLVPFALGTMHAASATSSPSKNAGMMVAGSGFVLAPIIGHVVVGEYERAGLFMSIPAISEVAMVALVAAKPDAIFDGTKTSRTAFGALFTVSAFIAAASFVDVTRAGERARAEAPHVAIVPMVDQNVAGIAFGGSL